MRGPKKAAMVLLAVLSMTIASCKLPGPWVTVFSDAFNRDDNDDVGNFWSEVDLGGVPAGDASISGHALLMTGGNSSQKYMAIVRGQPINGDFRFTFSFTFPDGALTRVHVYLTTADMDAVSGWYVMGIFPAQLGVWRDSTTLPGSTNITLDPTHTFAMEMCREGTVFTLVLTDTNTSAQWTSSSTDDTYHDFTAIHIKAGDYDGTALSVLIDDFVLQTR